MIKKNSHFPIKLNLLDRFVSTISPKAGLQRIQSRARLQALEGSGYITPASGKRFSRDWFPSENNADQDILPKHSSIRAGSRDLYMNNPIAGAILNRATTNSVGWGLSVQSRIDRIFLKKTLGWKDEQFAEAEYEIEREFSQWGDSPNCDASRHLWFPDLQVLAFFNTLLSGDVFVALPYKQRKNSKSSIDLCVNVIEGDYVCNPHLSADTNKLAGGIEVDGDGEVIRYHFRRSTDQYMLQFGPSPADKWTSLDAYDQRTGRPQVLHLFHKERPGQRRGVAMLAPLFEELRQITRLSKAELDAAIVNSFFTVFVKSDFPEEGGLGAGYIPALPSTSISVDSSLAQSVIDPNSLEAEKLYELGSGSVVEMDSGEEIQLADPKRPNAQFEPFYVAIVKQLGARIGIPFEVLLLHFAASYSASRGSILEAWKFFRSQRIWLVRYFNTPIYREVITENVLANRLDLPGFLEDERYTRAWLGAAWNGISQGQLDPLRETKADCQKIDYTLTTREDVAAKYNEDGVSDWEGILERAAREKISLTEKGLLSSPSSTPEEPTSQDPNKIPEEPEAQPGTPEEEL
jgi:lambda family phage portal protein